MGTSCAKGGLSLSFDGGLHVSNSRIEPVRVFPYSLSKGVYGGVVDSIAEEAPSLFCIVGGVCKKSLVDGL